MSKPMSHPEFPYKGAKRIIGQKLFNFSPSPAD
jgi:hypothetical protein